MCTLFVFGNNRQCRPICAKINSSWVRRVSGIAKAHFSLGTVWGVAVSAAFVAGVFLVSILQVSNWTNISTPSRHYFQHTSFEVFQLCWVIRPYLSLVLSNSSPIVCILLALDSWKYCSGDQDLNTQHICKIAWSSLCNWTMYINENKWSKVLQFYVIPSDTRWHTSSDSLKPLPKLWEEDVGPCSPEQ